MVGGAGRAQTRAKDALPPATPGEHGRARASHRRSLMDDKHLTKDRTYAVPHLAPR